MPEHHSTIPWAALISLLAILLIFAGAVLSYQYLRPAAPVESYRTDIPPGFPQDAPAPTPEDYVESQAEFHHIVAYTDSGFVPASLTVKEGETIRITNTGSAGVGIAFDGGTDIPLASRGYTHYIAKEAGKTTILSSSGSSVTITIE